jgi:hypothetical protein
MVEEKKARYFIQTAPKNSTKDKKVYFATYAEAKKYVEKYIPGPKGMYHINPVDHSGMSKPSKGRRSYHE